jgi:penicillin-insensitive murein endopeptidase
MLKYLLISGLFCVVACTSQDKWGSVKTPTQNPPQVYGSYTAGCMDGAVALPLSGYGYELENGARNRFYGQPSMINFLQKYAAENKSTLYISDIAQPRGGPVKGGHGSHQTGLDADIWYGKKDGFPVELVSLKNKSLNGEEWQNFDWRILKNAAEFAEVERVFVNPRIKAKLCETHKGEGWLSKIRPWWQHNDHFHVRLSCPSGDKLCKAQAAVPSGDGCDATLDWWFSKEAEAESAKTKVKEELVLPEQCGAVLESGK